MYYNSSFENIDISGNLREKVNKELEAGEGIKWVDKPKPKFFTATSTAIFLFSIPWTAFAIFWTFGAAGFKIPDFKEGFDFFPLFGLPFIIIGLVLLSTPLRAFKKDKKTVYVITNRRAIIFTGGISTTIRSFPPESLKKIYRKEKEDGSGDIIITHKAMYNQKGARQTEDIGFFRISNSREVEQMLRRLAGQVSSEKKGW